MEPYTIFLFRFIYYCFGLDMFLSLTHTEHIWKSFLLAYHSLYCVFSTIFLVVKYPKQ